jgi:hypothetical protein
LFLKKNPQNRRNATAVRKSYIARTSSTDETETIHFLVSPIYQLHHEQICPAQKGRIQKVEWASAKKKHSFEITIETELQTDHRETEQTNNKLKVD